MQEKNLCSNLLTEGAFIQIPYILIDYFGEDKDSLFMLIHFLTQHKFLSGMGQIDEFDYFYSTVESIKNKYHISDYCQRKAIKHLEDKLFITTLKKGLPAKRYIRINFSGINKILNSQAKDFTKKDPTSFYHELNKAIETSWEDFKFSMDNMNKLPALTLYFWKRLYDKKNPTNTWKWNSKLFGIINSWVLGKKKTGLIDYSYIVDYLNSDIIYATQEEALKKFTVWSKNQLEKSPSIRLTDYDKVLNKANE